MSLPKGNFLPHAVPVSSDNEKVVSAYTMKILVRDCTKMIRDNIGTQTCYVQTQTCYEHTVPSVKRVHFQFFQFVDHISVIKYAIDKRNT